MKPFDICEALFWHIVAYAACRALFNAGGSIAARIAMIAITMRSSIRVKILIFTLRSKNLEQGTRKEEGTGKQSNNRTSEQFNNGAGNGEVRSGDWQRSALPCCRRNEIPLLQLFFIRSSIRVKIPLSYFIIDFLSCIFDDMLILLCFLFR